MDPIPLEDLALLEVLLRIDQRIVPLDGDTEITARLAESGLVEESEDGETVLTVAGVELCKSLQHRLEADAQAERVLHRRERSGPDQPAAETLPRG